jgi:spermidine/putrescine transport system ATP-binding protein
MGIFELEKPPAWEKGVIAIRPEWIRVSDTKPAKNGIRSVVTEIIYRGTNLDIWLNPGPIRVRTSTYKNIRIGDEVWLDLAPREMAVLGE